MTYDRERSPKCRDKLSSPLLKSQLLSDAVNLSFTESRYIFVDWRTDWDNAQAYCESEYNSNLATITSQADADALFAMKQYYMNEIKNSNVWLWTGLRKTDGNLPYAWVSGYPWLSFVLQQSKSCHVLPSVVALSQ